MTEEQYRELYYNLHGRLVAARKARCPLTAKARLREIAHLKSDYTGQDYIVTLYELINQYQMEFTYRDYDRVTHKCPTSPTNTPIFAKNAVRGQL